MHSLHALHNDAAYLTVFGSLPRVFVGSFCAVLIGGFINVFFITKWKVIVKGKYFWVRSTISSAVGELVFVVVAFLIEFYGKIPLRQIFNLMIFSYGLKISMTPILAVPGLFLVYLLKKIEGMEVYDEKVNFNPFSLNVDETNNKEVKYEV